MTDKSVEQKALDTLNALIAGGYFPENLIGTGTPLTVNTQFLTQIEEQLRQHYSTGPHEPAARPKARAARSVPLRL